MISVQQGRTDRRGLYNDNMGGRLDRVHVTRVAIGESRTKQTGQMRELCF
jgi:hypothetical protein